MSRHGSITVDVDIDEFDDEAIVERFLTLANRGNLSRKQLDDASKAIKFEIADVLPPPIIDLKSVYAREIIETIKSIISRKGEFEFYNEISKL